MPRIDTKDYLTTAKAAEALGLSVDSVKKYCQLGRIEGTKIGREWLIHKSEVDKYNKDRREYIRAAM